MSLENDVEAVLRLEMRRMAAGASGDLEELAAVLADDHVHVHGSGRVDTKASLIELARGLRRRTDPRRPDIRLYGDVAVLTGPITIRVDRGSGEEVHHLYATQVARRRDGEWRFVSIQVTPIALS